MKVVISQVNVGSKFRFMPSGVSASLSNYPRDGWLTESAARKWAKQNGHEIVKVEKVAGKGEKIHRIEYTYTDRFGKTKKQVSELVGKDVEPLKKRIVEGLTRNGDTLVSFGKITAKDGADEPSLLSRIAEKYAMDAAMGIKISGNEKGSERLIMEKVFKDWLSPAAAWQKVKKGNTIMIRYNGDGPNKKLKGKDVLKIEYFNQHVVAMTPRYGVTQLVGFPRINVMVGKLASEGLRSYPEFENQLLKKDSADELQNDTIERVMAKYCMDVSKGPSNEKRYEVHYQATAPDGHIYVYSTRHPSKKYLGDAEPIPGKKYRSTKTGKIVDGAEAKKICDRQMKIMNGAKMPWDEKTLRKMMDFDFFIPVELLAKK